MFEELHGLDVVFLLYRNRSALHFFAKMLIYITTNLKKQNQCLVGLRHILHTRIVESVPAQFCIFIIYYHHYYYCALTFLVNVHVTP